MLPPNWQSAMSQDVASLMISSSSAWNVRLMAAKTSSLEVCLAGPNMAVSLQPGKAGLSPVRMMAAQERLGRVCTRMADKAASTASSPATVGAF